MNPPTENPKTMNTKILYLFTRTPLHVGAGSSVGAIDQPIVRERHTAFPIIPASSLKGTFADAWNDGLHEQNGKRNLRVKTKKENDKDVIDEVSDAAWLFGSDNANHAFAGALQFSEARLLAFPIRSAKGSFAWITCPLMLQRAARDSVVPAELLKGLTEPSDDKAIFDTGTNSKLALDGKVVLEEYTFEGVAWLGLSRLGERMAKLLPAEDAVWQEISSRLVILSNGMMSFFAQNACEVAQHVKISDETGTAEGTALFNQENVPSETLFYAVVHAVQGRGSKLTKKTPDEALTELKKKVDGKPFQFGGDASTGLGYCTVAMAPCEQKASAEPAKAS
jgi:CRISPR-associated protein Cmr4